MVVVQLNVGPVEALIRIRAYAFAHDLTASEVAWRIISRHLALHDVALMLLLEALIVVLVFARLRFALHVLWIVEVALLVLWLVGFVIGRGEGAANRRLYKWQPARSQAVGGNTTGRRMVKN